MAKTRVDPGGGVYGASSAYKQKQSEILKKLQPKASAAPGTSRTKPSPPPKAATKVVRKSAPNVIDVTRKRKTPPPNPVFKPAVILDASQITDRRNQTYGLPTPRKKRMT